MLPTPSTSHVNYAHIYEPAEDSYLLLDTLASSSQVEFLRQRFPSTSSSPLVVEVGTGSGVVLAFATAQAQHIFGRMDILSLGIDVNSFACKAATQTMQKAVTEHPHQSGGSCDTVQSDLASALRQGQADVLIFNPPYVPTEQLPAQTAPQSTSMEARGMFSSHEEFERDSHLLSLSYAGGLDGMETTNRLLGQLPEALSSRGVAFILLCAQNKPDEVAARICSWPGGWCAEKVGESGKTAGWEKLCILRIWRGKG